MTDILKPELLWIEGRCYRVNDSTTQVTALQEHDLYENETTYNDMEEEDESDFEVEMIDGSRYCTSIHVSKHYVGSIIGKKGAMKMRIERETKTEIKIPRQGKDGDIMIYASAVSNLRAARRRINIIVISSRMKQTPTHFISIPLNHPDVVSRFDEFKNQVLKDCPSRGLDESIFISGAKLHLTLGVMCLMDNEERLAASKLLNEARDTIVRPMIEDHLPVKIRIKGLNYMNDDPKEINVLYAQVQEEGSPPGLLQGLADALVTLFYKKGLMNREFGRDNVKLHATLINTKYRRSRAEGEAEDGAAPRRGGPRETFDGSALLHSFHDYDFGLVDLTDIHLSQRFSLGPDGFYQSTCVINCV